MKIRWLLVICGAAIALVIAAGGTWRFGPPVSPLLILNRSDLFGTFDGVEKLWRQPPDLRESSSGIRESEGL